MADLLTHYVSARLPGSFIGDPCARATLALGVFVPDLISKSMEAAPWLPRLAWASSHSALGAFFVAWALAMLFAEEFRFKAFATLLAGQLLHIAVDMGKDSLGFGSAFVLLPFSTATYDAGLYTSQHVFFFLPVNVAALFALRWLSRRAQREGWVWR